MNRVGYAQGQYDYHAEQVVKQRAQYLQQRQEFRDEAERAARQKQEWQYQPQQHVTEAPAVDVRPDFIETQDVESNTSSNEEVLDWNKLDNFKNSTTAMPYRFRNPETFSWGSRKQHPMYRTTSNAHGFRIPVREEMPTKYYGRKGNFTKAFHGGMYRDFGLNTSLTQEGMWDGM